MTEGADNSKTRKRGRRGGRKPKNIDEGQQIQPVSEFTSEKEPTNNNYSFEPIDLNSQFPQIPVDLMDYFMNIEKMIREPAFETDEGKRRICVFIVQNNPSFLKMFSKKLMDLSLLFVRILLALD
jgi:hypothetical protein